MNFSKNEKYDICSMQTNGWRDIAQETAICCNLPIYTFTGYIKNFTNPQKTNTQACEVFEKL